MTPYQAVPELGGASVVREDGKESNKTEEKWLTSMLSVPITYYYVTAVKKAAPRGIAGHTPSLHA